VHGQIRGSANKPETVALPGEDVVSREHVRRRLEAIMFADVVGYSRLTGQDEVGTWRRLRLLLRDVVRPEITTRAGRIVRIKGDGILVEFPSAVEAVASAVALQQALAQQNTSSGDVQRIELRIGINLGDVITNDEDVHGDGVNIACRLEPLADPGGICISATVYEHVRAKLPYPFEHRGERTLKNISAPVQIYSLGPEIIAALPKAAARSGPTGKSWRWLVAAVAVGSLGTMALWLGWQHFATSREPVVAANPSNASFAAAEPKALVNVPAQSIVVLPFTAAAQDQEYLAEGITEDLTTDLSRIPGSFVIARSTAFTYKGKPTDVRQIGRELSVRYAVQGTVRTLADSVRVNAQLVDTANAGQLWVDRFNGDLAMLAKLQDQITQRIAAALHVFLADAESQRVLRERPINPETVNLTMRGAALLNKQASRDSTARARELFESALQLTPDHLPALNGLAQTMLVQWQSTWYPRSSEEHLGELDRVMTKALTVKPDDAIAIYHRGYVLKRLHKDLPQALAAFERAIAVDPNLAVAHNYIGQIKVFLGRADEAAEHTLKAIQLSPRDSQLALWYYQLALTYLHQHRYAEAVDWGRRSVEVNPDLRYPYRILAAALALAGQIDEAKSVAAEMLRRYPNETISAFLVREPWPSPIYREGQNREVLGMRQAGIPE
jgi:adenylate cyclase